jgi:hypothetical protein
MDKKAGIYNLLNESIDDRETLNSLIEICFKIASHYARINSRRVDRQLNDEQDSIEDIAIDAIAPLFLAVENNELQIKRIFRKWGNNVANDQDALYFLNRITSRRVSQHITRIIKDADPFFAKIYDSVNYLIKKECCKKQNYFGTVYIIDKKINHTPISQEDFYNLPVAFFINTGGMIKNLLGYIENETEYFPAIPLNAFVKKIKQISFDDEFENNDPDGILLNYEIKQTVDLGLNKAKQKLLYSYERNDKLDKNEVESFEKTLDDISYDLKNGGLKPGLYEYLKFNMPELERQVFRAKYQNILEYLLKIMKHKVADELKK